MTMATMPKASFNGRAFFDTEHAPAAFASRQDQPAGGPRSRPLAGRRHHHGAGGPGAATDVP